MSWFSTAVSIDEQVQKATSESLPTGEQDLALNLEICDLIRSKTVQPKDAMRSLKRRLLNKNPNVQIATLHLTDVCIKNGGTHFLVEVASREFMDTVVLLIKPVASAEPNPDVQKLVLECIQNWAKAFEGQLQLAYVNTVYTQLKSEGFQFPYYSKQINSSFIDTSAPPEWVDSDTCMQSGTPFSFVNRKHHCRNCGGVFIQKYCNNYESLPHFGINVPVRICDGCSAKLKSGHGGASAQRKAAHAVLPPPNNDVPVIDDDMDADLKRALELSLAESQGTSAPAPSYTAPVPPTTVPATNTEEEDDEELKAAIAASLRDMNGGAAAQPSNAPSLNAPAQPAARPEWELTQTDEDNINMYTTLVEKMKSAPPGAILREGQIQDLNENIGTLRPKLARTLADTVSKYDTLVDMNAKLQTALRFYDNFLEDRLSYAYNRHSISDQPQHAPQHAPNAGYPYYPSAPLQPQMSGQPAASLSPQHTTASIANQYPPAGMVPSAPSYGGGVGDANPSAPAPAAAPGYDYNAGYGASAPSAPPPAQHQQQPYYQQQQQQPPQQPQQQQPPQQNEPPKEVPQLIEL